MEVTIRHATLDDAAAIADIYNDAVVNTTATWDEEPHSAERRRAWMEAMGEGECVLVAELDGAVIGWSALTRWNQKSGWRFTREENVYIHPEHQRRGVGRTLVSAILEEARAYGIHSVLAAISADNDASLRLHGSLGFEARGTLKEPGFKFGEWLDLVYMQRMLDP